MQVALYLSCKWDIFCHLCLQQVKGNRLLILSAVKLLFLVCFLNFHLVSLTTNTRFNIVYNFNCLVNEELLQSIGHDDNGVVLFLVPVELEGEDTY